MAYALSSRELSECRAWYQRFTISPGSSFFNLSVGRPRETIRLIQRAIRDNNYFGKPAR